LPYNSLRNWVEAQYASPKDSAGNQVWRLASEEDWKTLIRNVCGMEVAGLNLKASDCVNGICPGGIDKFGFGLRLFGFETPDGKSVDSGEYGYWWTSTEAEWNSGARYVSMGLDDGVSFGWGNKENRLLVMCVKN